MSTGVDNNETIKVSRSGGADPDGYGPGDLYVNIKVRFQNLIPLLFAFGITSFSVGMIIQKLHAQVRADPVFRREGSDIHVDAVLSITQVLNFFLCLVVCSV